MSSIGTPILKQLLIYVLKRSRENKRTKLISNKRPMGHIAYLSNNSQNKIGFIELYTTYLDNVV